MDSIDRNVSAYHGDDFSGIRARLVLLLQPVGKNLQTDQIAFATDFTTEYMFCGYRADDIDAVTEEYKEKKTKSDSGNRMR